MKRFWKACELKKIEGNLDRLKGSALNVIQPSSISRNSKTLKDIEKDVEELKQSNARVSVTLIQLKISKEK